MEALPFVANTTNDLRCAQAAMRMILLANGQRVSFSRLDDLTHRHGVQWTWNVPVQLAMAKLGYRTILFEDFDYRAFGQQGRKWLEKVFGQSWVAIQAQHADLQLQQRLARRFMAGGQKFFRRPARIEEASSLLRRGWYVCAIVNSAALHRRAGYIGHVVVVLRMTRSTVTIHDPGLPPQSAWTISRRRFARAFTGTMFAWRPR